MRLNKCVLMFLVMFFIPAVALAGQVSYGWQTVSTDTLSAVTTYYPDSTGKAMYIVEKNTGTTYYNGWFSVTPDSIGDSIMIYLEVLDDSEISGATSASWSSVGFYKMTATAATYPSCTTELKMTVESTPNYLEWRNHFDKIRIKVSATAGDIIKVKGSFFNDQP